MPTFYHSGSLGDQIYSLPTVAALGGGTFVSGMPLDAFMSIAPLLRVQGCIKHVHHISEVSLPRSWIDLSSFRNHPLFTRMHIADLHAQMQGVKINKAAPWLTVPDALPLVKEPYAVVAVTPRYRDHFFSWNREIMWLAERVQRIIYIGDYKEYKSFAYQLSNFSAFIRLHYYPTSNLLEAANMIADAQYFSGNQSVTLAIRQALGLPWRFEQSPNHRDTEQGTKMETKLNPYTRRLHLAITCAKRAIFDNQYVRI